jgi:uncharacterized protein
MTSSFRVTFRASATDIPGETWARCFPEPLEGMWWYKVLERSGLQDQFTFEYAVIARGADLVAIAPLFVMDLPIDIIAPSPIAHLLRFAGRLSPKLRFQRTLFVGSPCSDEGTLGVVEGTDLASVVGAVHQALLERAQLAEASMLVWKDFPQQYWPSLRSLSPNVRLFEVVGYPNTLIEAVDKDFDGYLQGLKQGGRSKLRRKLRRSHSQFKLVSEVRRTLDDSLVDQIWQLFQQTYMKAELKFERLTKAFFTEITRYDHSYVIVLRDAETNRPVAFMLCFLLGQRAINKFIGIDYGYGKQSFLYFRLWEEFVRWALRSGASQLQSGQTAYRSKLDFGHQLVTLRHFVSHRNRFIHSLFALVARHISWKTLDSSLRDHVEARARHRKKKDQDGTRTDVR